MRVMTEAVRLGGERREPGNWLSGAIKLRDRKGLAPGTLIQGATSSGYVQPLVFQRLLTADQLWLLYLRCPEVRAAVNSIARRIATWDHACEPVIPTNDPDYERADAACKEVNRWLAAPSRNGDTWQTFAMQIIIDLLVYDAASFEIVFDKKKELAELFPIRGSDIRVIVNQHGVIQHYVQDRMNSMGIQAYSESQVPEGLPKFEPKQLAYMRLFPTTANPEGYPLLEALFHEVLTILCASEHILRTVDADEIPPGILTVAGIANDAASKFSADMKARAGRDNEMRILTSSNPQGISVDWTTIQRELKDVQIQDVIRSVERRIWRTFGVLPIEMGEPGDAPRASTETQVSIGESHLIEPILELLEGVVNSRILPLLVDEDVLPMVRWRFDRQKALTTAEWASLANAAVALIGKGTMTRNEAREWMSRRDRRYLPIDGGDVATVDVAGGVLPLSYLTAGIPLTPDDPDQDGGDGDGDGDGGDTDPDPDSDPDPDITAPGEAGDDGDIADNARPTGPVEIRTGHGPTSAHLHRDATSLPSDWQPAGRFRGKRTIDLSRLAEDVSGYAIDVNGWWAEAASEAAATVRAAGDDVLDPDEAAALAGRLTRIVESLGTKWATGTVDRYRRAAGIGRDAVSEFAGVTLDDNDVRDRANVYRLRAMGWLDAADGPLAVLRARISAAVFDAQSARSARSSAAETRGLLGALATTVGAIFSTQRHRIDAWAGRLIELAYDVMVDGLNGAGAPQGSQGGDEGGEPQGSQDEGRGGWWVDWVRVSDDASCPTCIREGAQPIRPLSALSVRPGGGTECRANCRCVLVLHTEAEVRDGIAQKM